MKTLTLAQLSEDVACFKAHFGGAYPTTILELHANCRSIVAETYDQDDYKERFEQADKDLDELAKEITDLQEWNNAKEREINRLKELLSEKEKGKTILQWVEEAKTANAMQKLAEDLLHDAERECTAMRKRKGVQAGLFKHGKDVIAFLEYIRLSGKDPAEREQARLVMDLIQSSK